MQLPEPRPPRGMRRGEDHQAGQRGGRVADGQQPGCPQQERVEDARQQVPFRFDTERAQGIHLTSVAFAAHVGRHGRPAARRNQNRGQNRDQDAVQGESHRPQQIFDHQRLGVIRTRQEPKREVGRHETDDRPGNRDVQPGRRTGHGTQVVQQEPKSPPGTLPDRHQPPHGVETRLQQTGCLGQHAGDPAARRA